MPERKWIVKTRLASLHCIVLSSPITCPVLLYWLLQARTWWLAPGPCTPRWRSLMKKKWFYWSVDPCYFKELNERLRRRTINISLWERRSYKLLLSLIIIKIFWYPSLCLLIHTPAFHTKRKVSNTAPRSLRSQICSYPFKVIWLVAMNKCEWAENSRYTFQSASCLAKI